MNSSSSFLKLPGEIISVIESFLPTLNDRIPFINTCKWMQSNYLKIVQDAILKINKEELDSFELELNSHFIDHGAIFALEVEIKKTQKIAEIMNILPIENISKFTELSTRYDDVMHNFTVQLSQFFGSNEDKIKRMV